MDKENKKPRKKPNEKILDNFGISKATKIALTGKFLGPVEYNENIEVHDAVKKKNSTSFSEYAQKDSSNMYKNTKKIRQEAIDFSNEKLERLRENKVKYVNNRKLSHEYEQGLYREEMKRQENKSIVKNRLIDVKKIKALFSSSDIVIKVKTFSKRKLETEKISDKQEFNLTNEIKKLRIVTTNSFHSKTIDVPSNIKKQDHLSPSTEYFAKEFGWIQRDENEKRFLHENTSINVDSNEDWLNKKDDKLDEEFYNNNISISNDQLNTLEMEEIQLSDIQKIERKYKKEAEEIRKQMQKNVKNIEKHDESITDIYEKMVSNSISAMLSDKKESKNSDIDVSKISSFVLEQIREKEKKKSKK